MTTTGRAIAVSLLLLCAATATTPALAQEKLTENTYTRSAGSSGPPARVEDMAWLAGHWVGQALGGTVEEVWSPPRGGAMMGMFRLVEDGRTAFYELMTIRPDEDSLVLRLKHFNADLTGWEEKDETVDFPLVAVVDGIYRFEGLSFHREGKDRLRIHLAMDQRHGGVREVTFVYQRAEGH